MAIESHSLKNQKINIEGDIGHSNLFIGDWNRVIIINPSVTSETLQEQESAKFSNKSNLNPYKGLASFKESDADFYFGRETLVQDLWKRFQKLYRKSLYTEDTTRFLTILGPSGCGKSSLLMAGLVPELERKPLMGKDAIRIVILRPGKKVVRSLANAVYQLEREHRNVEIHSIDQYVDRFIDSSQKGKYEFLDDILSSFNNVEACPTLIIVDQFEQVYSHCQDNNERKIFIENLLYAARQKSGHVSVIATLRSDFFESAQKSQLNEVIISDNIFPVRPMTETELYLAITKPAEITKYPLDSGIVGHLVKEAKGKKGVLPLLQFALRQIWDGLSHGIEPIKTYYDIGGIGGALAKEAQEIYDCLPTKKEKDIAQRVFLNLVQTREGIPDTGRQVALKDLVTKDENINKIRKVIQLFASPSARLLTLDSDKYEGYETVEVTHEALFKSWQQFQTWLEVNREFIVWHEQLRAAKQQWIFNEEDEYSLLQGKALTEAEKWIEGHSGQLSNQEYRYIQLSFNLRHERLWKQRKQRYRNVGALAIILSLIVCGLFVYRLRSVLFQENLEIVLLEADNTTPEIERKLPVFLKKVEKIKHEVDQFHYQNNNDEAIFYYQNNKERIDKLIFFYKRIIEINNAIQIRSRKADSIGEHIDVSLDLTTVLESAETSLSELLYKYKIPKLKIELANSNFGTYQGGSGPPVKRFTEGALQTTYEIIVEDAGGDIDLNGQIENPIEVSHIPCQVLLDIETAWLSSSMKIGWQASNPENFELESLAFLVFDSAGPFIDSRVRSCKESHLSGTHQNKE